MEDGSESNNFCSKLYSMVMNERPSIIGFREGSLISTVETTHRPRPR